MTNTLIQLPKHESPLRRMVSNTDGSKYSAMKTLDDAKKESNAYVIMDGDDGGQIYLVCPVERVNCTYEALNILLHDLDALAWNDESMAGLYYEVHEPGEVISGGMGGGRAETELWIHERLDHLKAKIKSVIEGTSKRLEL